MLCKDYQPSSGECSTLYWLVCFACDCPSTVLNLQVRSWPCRGLLLAFACLCLQGLSMKSAVMDFGKRGVRAGMHYTALSRLRTAQGGYFYDLQENKIKADQRVVAEMARLRQEQQVKLFVPRLWDAPFALDEPHVRVITANVRGLLHHREDIERCPFLQCADVLILTETHLGMRMHTPTLPGFPHVVVASHPLTRRSGGVAIYSRHPFILEGSTYCTDTYQIADVTINAWEGLRVRVVGAYRRPGSRYAPFIQHLRRIIPSTKGNGLVQVVCGDFNMDCTRSDDQAGIALLHSLSSRTLHRIDIGTTHTSGRQIDHLWTSVHPNNIIEHGKVWSYFSDHMPAYATLRLGRMGEEVASSPS
jgi:endonuclease/exonuclease/phosphatase (EEP) superfamily protein YafD